MDSNFKPYDHVASFKRLDGYLDSADSKFEERDKLPDRDDLTFENGFYAYCSALFIDLRDSSALPSKYSRPVLAKIYRAFISEMVAILNSDPYTREVNIVGDCVWGVYNTPLQSHIDDIFRLGFEANSLMQVLGYKMAQRGYDTPLTAGIGLSYGRALMIKAGHSGSGINDVVYMGDVVNRAAHLASEGNRGYGKKALMVDEVFYNNLTDHNKGLLGWHQNLRCYTGEVVHVGMQDWYEAHCT
jgi:class 3 adenylate cyclase